jgi:hypothetical protein
MLLWAAIVLSDGRGCKRQNSPDEDAWADELSQVVVYLFVMTLGALTAHGSFQMAVPLINWKDCREEAHLLNPTGRT